jgi:hypothetical protein
MRDQRSSYDRSDGALERALLTGAIACTAMLLTAALRGTHDSGSAVAPINATSHVAWGDRGAHAARIDTKHTLLGLLVNGGASVFWSGLYEAAFGKAADRGHYPTAVLGGAAIAALAYVTDYRLVPRRLTPGWELRLSPGSLALMYVALALSFPLRGLLQRRRS